ncbi:pentatricopeptide repeat-containing protein At3g22670, mitochondrial-like [Nymphaea colorata]|uniref:pentatricopeptide repeat-containing protein At3g22670, mitochondrial-like n=1 Tax=Nymphaea colorata TaxID=210225 RepID=UPI00129EA3C9|nr:pentatricopeptide repeat-containing protein At3g22670, mitochondrial-like [Nymphaea colorata]
MLPRIRFLMSSRCFGLQRRIQVDDSVVYRLNLLLVNRFNGFSSWSVSSDLPDWFKYAGDQGANDSNDDFFVLPGDDGKLGGRIGRLRVFGNETDSRTTLQSGLDDYVEKISRVLRRNLDSHEATVRDLDGCGIDISKELVDRVLKRFSNDWKSALSFFRWVGSQRNYSHDADSYNAMVDILGKMKQFDEMWDLVEEMNQQSGFISLVTMSKIMRRYAGVRKWRRAVDAFNEMERFGLKKDTAAMNVLLDTLCKERRVERAREVFLELKSKIQPDAHTFNILIHGWCKAQRLDEAEWTMEEMGRHGFRPCVVSYTSIVEEYCRMKNFQKVDSLLDEMQAKGCPPNVVTYTIVMHALGKAKETDSALQIFERMKRNGCSPDTSFFNSLLYIMGRAGRQEDARRVLDEMINSGNSPNITTYNTLISIACLHSQEEYAIKLLQTMERSSCKPDLQTYAPLLKLFCWRKWMKVLAYLIHDMHEKDISLDLGTYTLLIRGLCGVKKLTHACLFFEEMVLKGHVPKYRTYQLLMEELDKNGMWKKKEIIQQWMAQAEGKKKLGCSRVQGI